MFLVDYTVAMVIYCVTKMITTFSPIIGQFFNNMIVASIDIDCILCEKEIFFSVRSGYRKSNQNQLGRVFPFPFASTCYKIYLNTHHCNVLWCVRMLVMVCVDCARACSKKPFRASLIATSCTWNYLTLTKTIWN